MDGHTVRPLANQCRKALTEGLRATLHPDYSHKAGIKHHTIRDIADSIERPRARKVAVGDTIQFYCWGAGYLSYQITVTPPIPVRQVWDFEMKDSKPFLQGSEIGIDVLGAIARNDGLSFVDMVHWLKHPKPTGPMQIICWSKEVEY